MKKYLVIIFIFITSLVCFTGCELDDLLPPQGQTQTKKDECEVTIKYNDKDETKKVEKGKTINLVSSNDNFSSWTIDGLAISYNKNLSITINKDIVINEVLKNDQNDEVLETLNIYSYGYLKNGKYRIYCKYPNVNDIEVVGFGFLISVDKRDEEKLIYNWNNITDYKVEDVNSLNEFELELNQSYYVICPYVITENGSDKDSIEIYHYGKIYGFGN